MQSTIDRANECEKIHLEENQRLRCKFKAMKQKESLQNHHNEEDTKLRNELVDLIDECDALKKAIAFARNYIEQEATEQLDLQHDIEQQIEQKVLENKQLEEALKSAFGSDAPNLFL